MDFTVTKFSLEELIGIVNCETEIFISLFSNISKSTLKRRGLIKVTLSYLFCIISNINIKI